MDSERLENYLYSEADLLSLENGGLGGFPYVDPGKSRHARKGKIRYVGKDWINDAQKNERVEGILRETAKKARVKTSSSWIRNKITPYVEKAVYYLNKLFAKETGYIADYGTVEVEEMKEDPYIRDKNGRIKGKIGGVYKRPTDDIVLNPELKKKEDSEGLGILVHELHHKGREYLGENGEYEEAFGPLAVPAIEAKTYLAAAIIDQYMRLPRSRLPTA